MQTSSSFPTPRIASSSGTAIFPQNAVFSSSAASQSFSQKTAHGFGSSRSQSSSSASSRSAARSRTQVAAGKNRSGATGPGIRSCGPNRCKPHSSDARCQENTPPPAYRSHSRPRVPRGHGIRGFRMGTSETIRVASQERGGQHLLGGAVGIGVPEAGDDPVAAPTPQNFPQLPPRWISKCQLWARA